MEIAFVINVEDWKLAETCVSLHAGRKAILDTNDESTKIGSDNYLQDLFLLFYEYLNTEYKENLKSLYDELNNK